MSRETLGLLSSNANENWGCSTDPNIRDDPANDHLALGGLEDVIESTPDAAQPRLQSSYVSDVGFIPFAFRFR